MVLHISLVGINIASLAIESLLFGIFIVLSISSFYLLLSKESHAERKNKLAALTTPLILANIVLTTTITAVSPITCTLLRPNADDMHAIALGAQCRSSLSSFCQCQQRKNSNRIL